MSYPTIEEQAINLVKMNVANIIMGLEKILNVTVSDDNLTKMYNDVASTLLSAASEQLCFENKAIDSVDLPQESDFLKFIKDKCIMDCTLHGDWSRFDFTDIYLENVDMTDAVIPTDDMFFIKLSDTSSTRIKFPKVDLNNYMLVCENMRAWTFTTDSKIPKDRSFFQNCIGPSSYEIQWPVFDMRQYDFRGVDIREFYFTPDTIMSDDKDFFQLLMYKSIEGTHMPKHDYRKYDFRGVHLKHASFSEDSLLPINCDFFIDLEGASVYNCKLPKMDLRNYLTNGVDFKGVKFTEDTILPDDLGWMTNIRKKCITNAEMPEADYSRYSFDSVSLRDVYFPEKSILPIDLFEQIKGGSGPYAAKQWPSQFLFDVIMADTGKYRIDFTDTILSEETLTILKAKFKNSKHITLP